MQHYLKGFLLIFGQKIIVPLWHKLSKYGTGYGGVHLFDKGYVWFAIVRKSLKGDYTVNQTKNGNKLEHKGGL